MSDIFILAPDPNGTCCDCSARMSVCDACTANPCTCSSRIGRIDLGDDSIIYVFQYLSGIVPFLTFEDAQAAITACVSNCIATAVGVQTTWVFSFTASFATNLSIDASINGLHFADNGIDGFSSINLKGGSVLTIAYSASRSGGLDEELTTTDLVLYNCDGSTFYNGSFDSSDRSVSGSVNIPITDTNEYFVLVGGTGDVQSTSFSSSFVISSSDIMTVNPVIALYDNPSDPTTPFKLPACPPLYIPFDFAGRPTRFDRFTDVASAEAALASSNASNCVGWSPPIGEEPPTLSFVATDMGGSLFMSGARDNELTDIFMAGAVYVLASSVLSIAYTNSTSESTVYDSVFVEVYDLDGTMIDSDYAIEAASHSGTFLFNISISQTIIIRVQMQSFSPGGFIGTATITSDMLLIVGKIQARYGSFSDTCASIVFCNPSP